MLIAAALSLLDLEALVRYYRVRKSALVLSVVASLGVIVFGVLPGIVIAVVLAVLLFFRRSWQPHGAVLGHVEGLGRVAQRRAVSRCARTPGHRGLPLGGASVLRELLSLPDPGPPCRRLNATRRGSSSNARR